MNYNIVTQSAESTVVAEYESTPREDSAYQSEAALEAEFIRLLQEQQYEYLPIHTESDLVSNLRHQLETLNAYEFSDKEWAQFYADSIARQNDGIVEKTRRVQEDYVQVLHRDNGESKNIRLIDKDDIHNNRVQVINQYEEAGGSHPTRYDVTLLVNGLPLVHVELKRRGVALREAFNQIDRYQRDSFWAGSGLYEYVQIFVISNGTLTKYYSNTTRFNHVQNEKPQGKKKSKTSNSFEFTSYWADGKNRIIPDLVDFTKTFLAKTTLLNILTRYCVFTSEQMLMVMRPYQIAATEKILLRLEVSNNYKTYGSIRGGGYIWHTTGSGKTLTSFKTAQLASRLSYIDKVLFVVDRKDLDYQTMKEYDRFEKGAANSNTSTAVLKRQLESTDRNRKIIITTIQKLGVFIKKEQDNDVFNRRIVIIFDECHRSQFGDMHRAITRHFRKYNLFGFTGTPIFPKNAGTGKFANLRTTAEAFGGEPDEKGQPTRPLHTYTIVDAINDKNVLPFRVDYIKTMDKEPDIDDENVMDIAREQAFMAPERIRLVTDYILTNYNRKTYRNEKTYNFSVLTNIGEVSSAKDRKNIDEQKEKRRLSGFNSILCVASIPAAKLYYQEFKKQMAEHPERRLKIATIFSYAANEEESDGDLPDEENSEDTSGLDQSSRDFLESAIEDYNAMFQTDYDTSSDKFQNYYKDVSLRMKNRDLDLLIVVNMFLTGFDATTLNTLWVDKNLRNHGLIQAFSRTNRILNSIKTFGNIVCFRNLQKRTDEAVALFGDKEAGGICLLRGYKDYYNGFNDDKGHHHQGYTELIDELESKFSLAETQITGEQRQKEFINLFGAILKMRNLLSSFDDFEGQEILSVRDMQDYQSRYNDLYEDWKRKRETGEIANINDDIVFEVELIRQEEITIDYILMLVKKYHDGNSEDKEIRVSIDKAIDSTLQLRSKKALIENFIDSNNAVEDIVEEWQKYVKEQKARQLSTIIEEEHLQPEETQKFIEYSFRDGGIKTTGTDLDKILPPMSRFGGARTKKKKTVIDRLKAFFERFSGLGE
jgi:type I restriction enzyme R subunit